MRTIAPWHQNPQLWGFKLPQLRDSWGPHSSQPLAYPPLGYTKLMFNLPGFCRNCPSKKGSEAWACKLIQTISKARCKGGRVSTEPDQEAQNWKRRWRPYPCPHIIDIKNDSKPQNNKKIAKNLFLFWHGESSQFLLKCKTIKKNFKHTLNWSIRHPAWSVLGECLWFITQLQWLGSLNNHVAKERAVLIIDFYLIRIFPFSFSQCHQVS